VTAALDHLSLERLHQELQIQREFAAALWPALSHMNDQWEMALVRIQVIEQRIEKKRRELVKAVS